MTRAAREEMAEELKRLLILEQEAIKKMWPHRVKPQTAANINKAEMAVVGLENAIDCLHLGRSVAARKHLKSLAGLAAPKKKTVKKYQSPGSRWYTEEEVTE